MKTEPGAPKRAPRYPQAKVEIDLDKANPFLIIGEVRRALKEAGASARVANKFNLECTENDFNHMLDVVDRYVTATWIGRDPRVLGERA